MSIKKKLFISFFLQTCLALGIVTTNLITYNAMQIDTKIINEAEHLRETSIKMAQFASAWSTEKNPQLLESLNSSIELYDSILINLSEGSSTHNISAIHHPPTLTHLNAIKEQWGNSYKPAYQNIISSKSTQGLAFLSKNVANYVNEINDMVSVYSAYSEDKVTQAKMINFVLLSMVGIISVGAFILLNVGINKPLIRLNRDFKDLAQGNGDLTQRIVVTSKDEIGDLTSSFNLFIEEIHNIIKDIAGISTVVSENMNMISSTTDELTNSTAMIANSSMSFDNSLCRV